jgi:hypothetical protein
MIDLFPRQTRAFDVLTEKEFDDVSELLYGGGAGGGKSMLGCIWLINQCLSYPGTRWVIGRKSLKTLKETTLNTFFEVAKAVNLGYTYRENRGISFPNGSEILLKDLDYYPSDPEFSELGSLEITGAFVDECDQITEKAWNILKSRIRYKLDIYQITPKILGTCNPTRNWVFIRFYEPFKNGTLDANKMFIQSLVNDNPEISRFYITNLQSLDEMSRERLLKGNWDYLNMSDLWTFSFRNDKHIGNCELNRSETVHLSFDFNRNPITCLVGQHYDAQIKILEIISIDNGTIYNLCDVIQDRYKDCFFLVTGDVSGKSVTTVSRLDNFQIIKNLLDLSKHQMKYSGSNPPLAESRQFINAMLEQVDITVDEAKCQPLIFDFLNVKSDPDGKPVKNSRTDLAQRADCLDVFRYYLHRFCKDFLKYIAQ